MATTMTLGYISAAISLLALWVATVLTARFRGFRRGWKSAETWIIEQDDAVEEIRMVVSKEKR